MRQRILLASTLALAVFALLVMTRVIDVGLLTPIRDGDGPAAGADPMAADAPDGEGKKPGLAVDANGKPVKRAAGSAAADAPEDLEPSEASGTAKDSGGGAIRGRVVAIAGPERAPVEGATVKLLRPDALFKYLRAPKEGRFDELTVRTDKEGKFAFRNVVPSKGYALLARRGAAPQTTTTRERTEIAFSNRAAGPSVAREGIELAARRSIDVGDLAFGATGGLAGHVTGADGAPVEGARVAVCWAIKNEFEVVRADPDTLPWVEAEAKTDAKGAWTCEGLEPGQKTVIVKAPSGLADVVTPVPCPEGSVKGDVDVSLAGRLSVAGVVVWSDGTPIAGARVFAGIQPKPAGYTVETGADGAFRIGSLAKGICIVGALVEGLPIRLETRPSAGDEHIRIEFPLPGSMAGKVVAKATGKPVAAFRVLLTPSGEDRGTALERYVAGQMTKVLGGTGFSSPGGAFRFATVRPGDYQVTVVADGYPEGLAGPITVVEGREAAVPTIELVDGNTVSGVVTDSAGKPVPGAKVYATSDGPTDEFVLEHLEDVYDEVTPVAVADDAGRFRSQPLSPASYGLVVTASGLLGCVLPAVDVREHSVEGLKAVLPSGGRVRVRVIDARGAAPGFGVEILFCTDAGVVSRRVTDEAGVLDASPLRPGRYVVLRQGRATRTAFSPVDGEWPHGQVLYDRLRTVDGASEVVVREGTPPEVTIRLPRLATVHGRAQLDGRPFDGHVYLHGVTYFSSRATAGGYEVRHVEPGPYHASVWVDDENGNSTGYSSGPFEIPDVEDHVLDLEFKSK